MAEKAITGINGNVTIGGSQICHVRSWSLNYFTEIVPYNSNCTGGAREKIPTIKDWNGSFQLSTEKGVCPPWEPGDSVVIALNTSTVAGEGCTYTGNAIIVELPVEVPIDGASELVTWAITFEGDGPLSLADNP